MLLFMERRHPSFLLIITHKIKNNFFAKRSIIKGLVYLDYIEYFLIIYQLVRPFGDATWIMAAATLGAEAGGHLVIFYLAQPLVRKEGCAYAHFYSQANGISTLQLSLKSMVTKKNFKYFLFCASCFCFARVDHSQVLDVIVNVNVSYVPV